MVVFCKMGNGLAGGVAAPTYYYYYIIASRRKSSRRIRYSIHSTSVQLLARARLNKHTTKLNLNSLLESENKVREEAHLPP